MKTANITVIGAVILCLCIMFFVTSTVSDLTKQLEIKEHYSWLRHILLNIFCYLSVIAPGLLFHYLVSRIKFRKLSKLTDSDAKEVYYEEEHNYCLLKTYHFCFGHQIEDDFTNRPENARPMIVNGESSRIKLPNTKPRSYPINKYVLLILCAVGLQLFYLVWGVLQEKIMTMDYHNKEKSRRFKDSQFLVFVNRILAFTISGIYLYLVDSKSNRTNLPFYRYIYCSLSNIMSSWCQYEALKFVSFPMQVLAKASKVVPVMIMNRIMAGTKFDKAEYFLAALMSAGLTLFMLATSDKTNKSDHVTTISGIILMCLYIVFDSFTSNYQGELFKKHSVTPAEMTFGVNLFSCLFTFMSMLQQGEIMPSIEFIFDFPSFLFDIVVLSICSAFGQLLIFFTISTFGAVTFTVIMTTRQAFAVLLSCVIYQHIVSAVGTFGIILVFISMFLRVYYNNKKRRGSLITKM